jgi:hypothetical protein
MKSLHAPFPGLLHSHPHLTQVLNTNRRRDEENRVTDLALIPRRAQWVRWLGWVHHSIVLLFVPPSLITRICPGSQTTHHRQPAARGTDRLGGLSRGLDLCHGSCQGGPTRSLRRRHGGRAMTGIPDPANPSPPVLRPLDQANEARARHADLISHSSSAAASLHPDQPGGQGGHQMTQHPARQGCD